MRLLWTASLICLFFSFWLFFVLPATAQEATPTPAPEQANSALTDKKKEIEQLEQKLKEVQGEKLTLAKTVTYLTTRINLTERKIEQSEYEIQELEKEVEALDKKIGILDVNLNKLTKLMIKRINVGYKKSNVDPVSLLLVSDGFNDFFRRYKYFKVTQRNDRNIIFSLEESKSNFDAQKKRKEEKQAEVEAAKAKLESQKADLAKQQKEKSAFLDATKNDERRYQDLIARAKAELEAIQAVIAGKGQETKVKNVNEGDAIASVIVGQSACSTGTHLHFEVVKDSSHSNPFSYLSSKSVNWDNADSQVNGSGSWRWPLEDPIRVTQSYGKTSYSSRYAGNFHTGVDMVSTDMAVKSVQSGELYRGAIGCGGGTLRYVRVKQADGIDTLYLHVNY